MFKNHLVQHNKQHHKKILLLNSCHLFTPVLITLLYLEDLSVDRSVGEILKCNRSNEAIEQTMFVIVREVPPPLGKIKFALLVFSCFEEFMLLLLLISLAAVLCLVTQRSLGRSVA